MVVIITYGSWIYNYLCNQCLSPQKGYEFVPRSWRGVLDTTLCDKVCHLYKKVTLFLSCHGKFDMTTIRGHLSWKTTFSHFWDRAVPVFAGVRDFLVLYPPLYKTAHTRLFPVKSLLRFNNFNQDLNYFHLTTILLHKYF